MSTLDLGKVVGSVIHNSVGAPAPGLGLPDDWAMDTASGDVYQRTAAAAWTKLGNFRGPVGPTGGKGDTGAAGAAGAKGNTGPAGAKGADGQTPTMGIDANGHLIATYT